jgi:hypothetical protein
MRSSPRDHGMDALRTLAVLGMMASHTSRLVVLEARPAWSYWVLLLEPIIPSLFLLLVGLSLARSFDASRARSLSGAEGRGQGPGAWYARQLKRAAILWGISVVFYTAELGFRLPDALTASGILANIAYAIILVGGLLVLPRRTFGLATTLVAGTGLFVWLDVTEQRVFAVNIGNSPFLPLWLFALGGAWWATAFRSGSGGVGFPVEGRPYGIRTTHASSLRRWVGIGLGILAGVTGIWLIARYGVEPLFTKPFGRSDAGRTVAAPFYGGAPLYLGYYNLRPLLALCCLGLQLGALTVLRAALTKIREGAAGSLFALGRHALGAYILHLALLAILVVTRGPRPLTAPWQGTAVWGALAVICTIWALWMEKRKSKRFTVHSGQ